MNIQTLQLFRALAHEKNISRVASKWNYVQSNVTGHLKRLEHELGVPLFHRHSRGLTLTPQGTYVLACVEDMLASWEHLQDTVSRSSLPYEPLVLGSINSMAATHLPALMSSLHQAHPSIDITLRYGITEELVQQVLQHECQGAFVTGPVRHPALHQHVFSTETLTLVSNPLVLPLESLQDVHQQTVLVLEPGCMFRERLLQMIHQEGIIPKQVITFSNLESLLGHVRAGMGIAMLSERYVRSFQDDYIACTPVPPAHARVDISFIYSPASEQHRSFQAFQDIMHESLRS